MRIILFILSLSILVLVVCSSIQKTPKPWNYKEKVPGIIFIQENVGIDQTEITNFNWLEYVYWTKRTFGENSTEYEQVLPDTTVWLELDSNYHEFAYNYLRSPNFRNFPVVGISKEQAQQFAKWRSDRVMEYLLIKRKALTWEKSMNLTGDSSFSIEKYRNNEISGLPYDPKIDCYPDYHLPTQQELNQALRYQEHLISELSHKQRTGMHQSNFFTFAFPDYVNNPVPKRMKNWLCNLSTNVSEWTANESEVFGQNYLGFSTDPTNSYAFETSSPHPAIGFRCAFNWKSF